MAVLKSLNEKEGNTLRVLYSINDRCGSTFPLTTQNTGTARIIAKNSRRIFEGRWDGFITVGSELRVNEDGKTVGQDIGNGHNE